VFFLRHDFLIDFFFLWLLLSVFVNCFGPVGLSSSSSLERLESIKFGRSRVKPPRQTRISESWAHPGNIKCQELERLNSSREAKKNIFPKTEFSSLIPSHVLRGANPHLISCFLLCCAFGSPSNSLMWSIQAGLRLPCSQQFSIPHNDAL
jgi:hypothetical protein